MQKISNNFNRALIPIFFMLVTTLAGQFYAVNAQTAAPALESATRAREILAQMDRAKIGRIKEPTARADLIRGYDALTAVAKNTSRTSEKVLLARVHTIALKLKDKDPQPAGINFADCQNKLDTCLGPPNLCQITWDGCIMMVRIAADFPPGAPG
jgi:hypothetical protein